MTQPTARARIERAFHVSFKTPEQAAELLDAYRDEVRAEAAACQRTTANHLDEYGLGAATPLLLALADVIDPSVKGLFVPARVRDAAADQLAARTETAGERIPIPGIPECPADCPCRSVPNAVAPLSDEQLAQRIYALLNRDGEFTGCPSATTDDILAVVKPELDRERAENERLRGYISTAAAIARDRETLPAKRLVELDELFNG